MVSTTEKYTLLLSKVHSVLLRPEGKSGTLHVIGPGDESRIESIQVVKSWNSRASPSHERILPPSSALEDLPVYPPTVRLTRAALGRAVRGLEYSHLPVTKLRCVFTSMRALSAAREL